MLGAELTIGGKKMSAYKATVRQSIEGLDDSEIVEKLRANYFSDEAREVAIETLKKRGVNANEIVEVEQKEKSKQKNASASFSQVKEEATPLENEGIVSSAIEFFFKLSRGYYGLAVTYWIYGVLAGFVLGIVPVVLKDSGSLLVLFVILSILYQVFVLMGIWRAANKYAGFKLWPILAKIQVLLAISSYLTAIGILFIV